MVRARSAAEIPVVTPSAASIETVKLVLNFALRIQWLVIFVLIAALLWLYISQQRFEHRVNERLQINEQIVSRLNEMDDRLFAMSQQTLPEPSVAISNQAQNQLDLLRIQIKAADRLLADNNDSAAVELLRGLHWQLAQSSNEIAPALTIVIKQSLLKDIERLEAQSAQPSPWQMQNLAIQNIQAFLHRHERLANKEPSTVQRRAPIASTSQNDQQRTASSALANNMADETTLTRRQLVIHEVIMTLNLASQASNMRERDQLVSYLTQARNQLKATAPQSAVSNSKNLAATGASTTGAADKAKATNNLEAVDTPSDISEVIAWLDQLIANAPKSTPLLTTQVLDEPQR